MHSKCGKRAQHTEIHRVAAAAAAGLSLVDPGRDGNKKKNDTVPDLTGTVYISVCLSRVAFALSLDTPLTSRPGIKQTLLNVEPTTSFINDNVYPFSMPAKMKKKERKIST
jgi:hypothetical protein